MSRRMEVHNTFGQIHMAERGSIEYHAMMSLASLATVSTLTTFLVYATHPVLRRFPANIVLCMSGCQMVSAVARLLSSAYADHAVASGTLCQVQGAMISFGDQGDYAFNAALMLTIVFCLHYSPSPDTIRRLSNCIQVFVWSFCTLTVVLELSLGRFGPLDLYWCWLPGNSNPLRLLHYIPIPLYMLLGLASVVYVSVRVRSVVLLDSSGKFSLVLRTAAFSLSFLVCIGWSVANRLFGFLYGYNTQFLSWAHQLGVWIYPIVTSLIWLLSENVRHELSLSIRQRCGRGERLSTTSGIEFDEAATRGHDAQGFDHASRAIRNRIAGADFYHDPYANTTLDRAHDAAAVSAVDENDEYRHVDDY